MVFMNGGGARARLQLRCAAPLVKAMAVTYGEAFTVQTVWQQPG
jgi:hypothetical protein